MKRLTKLKRRIQINMEDKKIEDTKGQPEGVYVRKVWKNKSNGQKLVTIPKDCPIEDGEEIIFKKKEEDKW